MNLLESILFCVRDLFSRRSGPEMLLGGIALAVGAAGLLIVAIFTRGVNRYVDFCFAHAKPIIGTLIVRSPTGKEFTPDIKAEMDQRFAEMPGVERPAWVAVLDNLSFMRTAQEPFLDRYPSIWSLPHGDQFFTKSNGVWYVDGSPLNKLPQGLRPKFGVLLNIRYLEDLLDWREDQLRVLLRERQTESLPREVFLSLPPVPGKPSDLIPQTRSLPVLGYFSLRDKDFPHLVLSHDVAEAYFYQGRESFEPSYAPQFDDGAGEPLVGAEEWTASGMKPDPDRTIALPAAGVINHSVRYRACLLGIRDFRKPGERLRIKEQLERLEPLGTLPIRPNIIDALNRRQSVVIAEVLPESVRDWFLGDERVTVRTRMSGKEWRLIANDTGRSVRIRREDDSFVVFKEPSLNVSVPSDTVSESLNNVNSIVDFYTNVTTATLAGLCLIVALILSLLHIQRRRRDIGLLKACGMKPHQVAFLYGGQVALLGLLGFAVGTIVVLGINDCLLEPWAAARVRALSANFTSPDPIMVVEAKSMLQAFGWMFAGISTGTLIGIWRAISVRPVRELAIAT